MDKTNIIRPPSRKEKLMLKILVILGLLSIINFFHWFLTPEFIDNKLLYWLLIGPLAFDSLRVDCVSIAIYGLPDKNITDPKKQESSEKIFNRTYWCLRFIDKPLFITEFGEKGIVST